MFKTFSQFQFSFRSELQRRFFLLNYRLQLDYTAIQENILSNHKKYTQQHEDQGNLLFGYNNKNNSLTLLFHANDERTVKNYMDEVFSVNNIYKDPIVKEGLVNDYEIKEIEIKTKGPEKELAQIYKFR